MFDGLKYSLIEVPYSMISSYFTGGINIFNLEIPIIDVFSIGLIIILYIAYVLKYNSDTSLQKSYKEFIIRTILIFGITIFAFGRGFFTNPLSIIEGNVYTHNAIKESMSESAQFTSQDIFNKQYIVEGVGAAKKTKIEGIGSYIENGNNFYIDTKAPIYVKFNVVYNIEKFIQDGEDPENLGIKTINKKIVNLDTPIEVLSVNKNVLDGVSLNTTIIPDGDNQILVKNPPQFLGVFDDKFKKTYFGKTTYLNDFGNAPLLFPTNENTYYIVDDSDNWIMKVMKVYKSGTDIKITFYVIPNLYTYQLEKTAAKSTNMNGDILKVYKRYKSLLTGACTNGSICSFDDIYKQKTKNVEFSVNDFLSAFSLMNGGFNSSIKGEEKYKITINGKVVQSFIGFFDNLSRYEGRTNALGNNFNGMNYVNNKYIVSYVADKNGEIQRNAYGLGIYGDNSFFKNFYVTPVGNGEIGFWGTIAGVLFLGLFFFVYIFGNFFIVFIVYQILN